MSDLFDYEEQNTPEENPNSDNLIKKLSQSAKALGFLEEDLAQLEKKAKEVKKQIDQYREQIIPEIMDELGMSDFTTNTGIRVKVEPKIFASLPKGNELEGLNWLRNNGQAGIIKQRITVEFSIGQDGVAKELFTELLEKGYLTRNEQTVHPQTLSSFVRRELQDGREVPMETLGAFSKRVAKIELSKKTEKFE